MFMKLSVFVDEFWFQRWLELLQNVLKESRK